eukprot:g2240.t1
MFNGLWGGIFLAWHKTSRCWIWQRPRQKPLVAAEWLPINLLYAWPFRSSVTLHIVDFGSDGEDTLDFLLRTCRVALDAGPLRVYCVEPQDGARTSMPPSRRTQPTQWPTRRFWMSIAIPNSLKQKVEHCASQLSWAQMNESNWANFLEKRERQEIIRNRNVQYLGCPVKRIYFVQGDQTVYMVEPGTEPGSREGIVQPGSAAEQSSSREGGGLLSTHRLGPSRDETDEVLWIALASASQELRSDQAGVARRTRFFRAAWCAFPAGQAFRPRLAVARPSPTAVKRAAETASKSESRQNLSPWTSSTFHAHRTQHPAGQLLPRRDRERKGLTASLLSWEEWPTKEELISALDLQLENGGGLVLVHGGPGSGKTELAAHVRAWANEHDLTVLAGQNQSPTGTITVPRLCWQEVFGALLKEARADPFWNPKNESANDREILRRLLDVAGATKELLAWLPVLRLFFPGLYFGPNVVNAMVERDDLHATRPSRVVTLCKMLISAFARHSTTSNGTVVLLHLRRSTSFFGQSDDYDERIDARLF